MLICPLIDKYNQYCFEADAQATVDHVVSFRSWSKSWNRKSLIAPSGYPPYLDSQFLVYTSATYIVEALKQVRLVDPSAIPTEASLAMYTIRRVNVCCRVLAALALFCMASRVVHSALFGWMAGMVFLLLTQLIQIDLLRIDHAVIAALSWLMYFSLACLRPSRNRAASLIGISVLSAVVATTKVSCMAFLSLPATSVLFLLLQKRLRIRQLLVPGMVFVATVSALSFRYIIFRKQTPNAIHVMLDSLKSWQSFGGGSPHFYYNWDLFLSDGVWLLGMVGVSWLVLAVNAIRKRRADDISVLAWTLFFSITGYGVLKYSRGGYHLALLYLTAIIMAAGAARRWLRLYRCNGLMGIGCSWLLLPVLYSQGIFYGTQRHRAEMQAEATRILRIEPREWIQHRMTPTTRVTIPIHSEWALPPIFDLGLNTKYRFLDMPYLDPQAVKRFEPPTVESVMMETDLIVLNDFHCNMYVHVMKKDGFADLATRWDHFFEDLPKHFRVVDFSTPTDSYGIRAVRIVIVNPDNLQAEK